MPRLLNLAKKKIGKLRVIRLLKARDKHGHTLWLCRCACGAVIPVPTARLRSGEQESCGRRCPLRRKRCGIPITSKAAHGKYKASEARHDEEGEWLAPRTAARLVKASTDTLCRWKEECPWLDGKGLRHKGFPDGYGRETDYYLKEKLNEILAAKAERATTPDCPGLVSWQEACEELGVSDNTLRNWLRAVGKKPKRVHGKRKYQRTGGRLRLFGCRRSYVPADFVAECRTKRRVSVPDGKATVKEAAAMLGVSKTDIHNLITAGLLEAEDGEAPCAAKPKKGTGPTLLYWRPCKLVNRDEINRLRDAMRDLPTTAIEGKSMVGSPGQLHLAADWLEGITGARVMPSANDERAQGEDRERIGSASECEYMRKMRDHTKRLERIETIVRENPDETARKVHQRLTKPTAAPNTPKGDPGRPRTNGHFLEYFDSERKRYTKEEKSNGDIYLAYRIAHPERPICKKREGVSSYKDTNLYLAACRRAVTDARAAAAGKNV